MNSSSVRSRHRGSNDLQRVRADVLERGCRNSLVTIDPLTELFLRKLIQAGKIPRTKLKS